MLTAGICDDWVYTHDCIMMMVAQLKRLLLDQRKE